MQRRHHLVTKPNGIWQWFPPSSSWTTLFLRVAWRPTEKDAEEEAIKLEEKDLHVQPRQALVSYVQDTPTPQAVHIPPHDQELVRAMELECERYKAAQLQDWEDEVLRQALGSPRGHHGLHLITQGGRVSATGIRGTSQTMDFRILPGVTLKLTVQEGGNLVDGVGEDKSRKGGTYKGDTYGATRWSVGLATEGH